MARGLEELVLENTELTDAVIFVLAAALASGRNTLLLTLQLHNNCLTTASVALLLRTLGACQNVTLKLDLNELPSSIEDLVERHQLVQSSPGIFESPRAASQ
ncbi:hypothetical protein SDRG_12232 [Saprolegnia diclina VS20]|uniref:Uncharacterized protein n=1 Tax=Saprolegnia diclina (strain VS20) TaxID=1156394 RepID=T0Q925_SAPDV|nr:hypothetical protein SDRG_12232 [Saprolegnia diclina VS20]EQC29950.1 hypothetical protein SDRG_12232 [Saprolegnia diclina VS20]|eukprot:XP_008616517.1 hypothetical protein SDRG_12232 [Saprolegnia diclina VS20]